MKIPVYEKQQRLHVTRAQAGSVFRPSPALFEDNQYTRLAQGLEASAGAGALLGAAQEALAKARQKKQTAGEDKASVLPPGTQPLMQEAFKELAQQQQQKEDAQNTQRRLAVAQASAALASTPKELEELMDKNFSASCAKNFLRAQALSSNLSAALAQGKTPQAAEILARFEGELTPPARQGALQRLQNTAAENAAQEAFTQALKEGQNPALWTDKELDERALNASARYPQPLQQETRRALQALSQGERARIQKTKAALLGQVLSGAQNGEKETLSQALFSFAQLFPQEETCVNAAVRDISAGKSPTSRPGVYNRLYEQVRGEEVSEEKLSKEFSAGRISGRDYLQLLAQKAALRGGTDETLGRLLCSAVGRLCRKEGLSSAEADDFKYAVYSLPGDDAAKLSALKKLRDIYFL